MIRVLQAPSSVGVPGWALKDTIVIQVTDTAGNPRAHEPLVWTVRLGGGSLDGLDAVTDAAGYGRARWTLGTLAGPNQAEVRTQTDSVSWTVEGGAFRADRIDAAYDLACGLRSGDLWCWPWGPTAPVSIGPPWAGGTASFGGPTLVATGEGFTDLAVGGLFACALTPSHFVKCYPASQAQAPVEPVTPALRSIAGSGGRTFCGLAEADSTAWCWGMVNGPLTAVQVPGAERFLTLSIEGGSNGQPRTACGVRPDSTVACWGDGPLGDGNTTGSSSPTPIASNLTFARVTAGDGFACGERANGDAWCWGANQFQMMGSPGADALIPVRSATNVRQLAAGQYTVAALQGGRAARWGQFGDGQGHALTPLAGLPNTPVIGFSDNVTSCLLLEDGQVYCYLELWVNSSTLDIDLYLPVQPFPAGGT